ncbi:MAG: HAD family hydrolase, partial [Cyanobacteria bacterium J06607_15]
KWNISPAKTIVCGDSGNDISMFAGQEKGLIVANAKPELLQWYEVNSSDNHYLAKSNCAAGIMEGLQHFSFI